MKREDLKYRLGCIMCQTPMDETDVLFMDPDEIALYTDKDVTFIGIRNLDQIIEAMCPKHRAHIEAERRKLGPKEREYIEAGKRGW